jgi:hypothetical protein
VVDIYCKGGTIMSNSATVVRKVDVPMQKDKINCMCGNKAQLIFKAKIGRVKDQKVTVFRVPVYSCDDCGTSFMNGSDSIKFAERVDEAIKRKLESINF